MRNLKHFIVVSDRFTAQLTKGFDPLRLGEERHDNVAVARFLDQVLVKFDQELSCFDFLSVLIMGNKAFASKVYGAKTNVNDGFKAVIGNDAERMLG